MRTLSPMAMTLAVSGVTSAGLRGAHGAAMQILKDAVGSAEPCEHLPESVPVAQANQCQECGSGFNVRLCGTCGHVGCCDSQAGHARTHVNETGHPVIYADPRGGGFTWCYPHKRYL